MGAFPEVGYVDPASVGGFAVMARPVQRRGPARRGDRARRRRAAATRFRPRTADGELRPRRRAARRRGRAALRRGTDDPDDDLDDDLDDWTRDAEAVDEVRERAAVLLHPDLVVHRLGLSLPLAPTDESELVAALSELVGFDPEDGVYCLAPACPASGVISRAARAHRAGIRPAAVALPLPGAVRCGPDRRGRLDQGGCLSSPSRRRAARGSPGAPPPPVHPRHRTAHGCAGRTRGTPR